MYIVYRQNDVRPCGKFETFEEMVKACEITDENTAEVNEDEKTIYVNRTHGENVTFIYKEI